MRHARTIAAAATLALALSAGTALAAGHPAAPGGAGGAHPMGQPAGGPLNNPNGMHPIGAPPSPGNDTDRGRSENKGRTTVTPSPNPTGKPATHGDTDRGRSEGKGHNDRMHTNNRAMHGTLVSLVGNVATVRLANGKTQTFTLTSTAGLSALVGKPITFKVKNNTMTLLGTNRTKPTMRPRPTATPMPTPSPVPTPVPTPTPMPTSSP